MNKTIILSVKIVLTLRVKLPCPKCKILILREIFVLSFIVSEKIEKKMDDALAHGSRNVNDTLCCIEKVNVRNASL
jgi:hypothetical protein